MQNKSDNITRQQMGKDLCTAGLQLYWFGFYPTRNDVIIGKEWSNYIKTCQTGSQLLYNKNSPTFVRISIQSMLKNCLKCELNGFACAFDLATSGSSPKHTIYAFINLYWFVSCGKDENKQKEARLVHFLKLFFFFKKRPKIIKKGRGWPTFKKQNQHFNSNTNA